LSDGCIQCRTLTVDPCLIGLDGAEVVLSVSGDDGAWSCDGRFKGVRGPGIPVPDANAQVCLLEEDTILDAAAGSLLSCQSPSSSEPVSHEGTAGGAGISNGFGTEYLDL
jgi:hypothetical protein